VHRFGSGEKSSEWLVKTQSDAQIHSSMWTLLFITGKLYSHLSRWWRKGWREISVQLINMPSHWVEDLPTRKTHTLGVHWSMPVLLGKSSCGSASDGPGVEGVRSAINEFFTTHFLFWVRPSAWGEKAWHGVYALMISSSGTKGEFILQSICWSLPVFMII